MRISFDAKRAFNNHTGLGNYSRFVIDSLLKFYPQHEYYLFTPSISDDYVNYFKPQENLHIITPTSFIHKTFPSSWRSLGLLGELEKYKMDVFHGLSNELPNGIERSNIKSIVTIHDLIFLRYPNYYNNIDSYIYKKKFKNACEHATKIISVSEQTKQDIISYFKIESSKINLVYQDCDKQFYVKQSAQHIQTIKLKYNLPDTYFIAVGTIEKRKNQLNIIKAIASLKDKSIKLVVVGKATDYKKQLDDCIAEHNLQEQIIFIPKIDFEDLPALYQSAVCAIYISEFEGFGIPVLEALRSHIPVIASNVSSIPEVGGEAALYVSPDDVQTLSNHINDIHTQAELRKSLIEKGISQAEKIKPQLLIHDLMKIYEE